jgi:hypothetical protein
MTKNLFKLQQQKQIYNLTITLYLFAESREKARETEDAFEFVALGHNWQWCFFNTKELDKSLHKKALKDLQEIGNIDAVENFKSLKEKNLPEIFLYEIEYKTHLITNSKEDAEIRAADNVLVLESIGYSCFSTEIADYGCTLDNNPALTKQQVANGTLRR